MPQSCIGACARAEESKELRSALSVHSRRLRIGSDRGQFEFYAAQHICASFSSTRDDEDLQIVINASVATLSELAHDVIASNAPSSMAASLECFDGIVSFLLHEEGVRKLPDEAYASLIRSFGDRVLSAVLATASSLSKIKRFNCGALLQDHFAGWKEGIDLALRDQLLRDSRGWSVMEKQLRRREMYEPSACSPRGDNAAFYDFSPVLLRTPLHVRSDVSRIHVSFFRYLVGKREFARHIVSLVSAHNDQCSNPEKLNDSNVTQINNTPGRRGSVDSLASYQTAEYTSRPVNSSMDLFSVHCETFLSAFGTGLLLQISNDILNAMTAPPTDFLRLVISMPPTQASAEGHSAVQKFLSGVLVASLRNLVHKRGHHSAAEDSCLSFLMKAEMSALGRRRGGIVHEYRVVSALIECALRLTVDTQSENQHKRKRGKIFGFEFLVGKYFLRPNHTYRLAEWLSHFTAPQQTLVHAIMHAPDGRKELRSIYREIAAASVAVEGTAFFWEHEFAIRVNQCPRMARADFKLLFTTANGLGISPCPVVVGSERAAALLQSPQTLSPPLPISPVRDVGPMSRSASGETGLAAASPFSPAVEQPETALVTGEKEEALGAAEAVPVDYRAQDPPSDPPSDHPSADRLLIEELFAEMANLRVKLAEVEKDWSDEFDSFKAEVRSSLKERKKQVSPKFERDDVLLPVASADERVEAIFKRLAGGS